MSKAAVVAATSEYRDLIKEVYIDPIRTVVVIDDEFPSLDGMIAKELNENGAWKGKLDDVKTVKDILQFCRHKEKPWLVDVHDGSNIPFKGEEVIAPHLIHSDLMILDFNLNDTGEKAIKILRKLASNNHFNMVVVYTNAEIKDVARDITLGLTCTDEKLAFLHGEEEKIKSQLGIWEDEDEKIIDKLNAEITEQVYLNYRATKENGCNQILRQPEGKNIIALHKQRPKSLNIKPIDIIKWLLLKKENEIKEKLSIESLGHVSTASPETDINWIRTDCLFVTVVKKNNPPDTLPEKLLDALHEWCPKPHRLLMSQMRFLMDDRGVIAESEILENNYLQAGWLMELLETKAYAQKQLINNTVSKHWEALGDVLRKDISTFADKLTSHLKTYDTADVIAKHCNIKINIADIKNKDDTVAPEKQSKTNIDPELKKINKHINCYNNTKPVDGYHLTTGHILELDNGPEKEYWICLSPACDLVPEQKTAGLYRRVEGSMPFVAVELTEIGEQKAIEEVNLNIFVFLEIDKKICTFTIHRSGYLHSNLVWEQMIAANNGVFDIESKELQIFRPSKNPNDEHITMEKHKVRIVAQLQYEYALNLLQRFGATMSRVGLDFSK
ncbi:response regulator receiver domain [Methylovulum miyakonense]|uniref:response regulator receiver domain n=1 Tax=Methylovulum miyakonense TaxID=645578 RepID=UPI000363BA01|nr:response regulator receiver domain [Methylovulum miyakonense]